MRDRKLSVRTQIIAATCVVLFFGGGWLAVWKWPHLRFCYRMRGLDSATRLAMEMPAGHLDIPSDPPSNWVRIDLGVVGISVPPTIRNCELCGHSGIRIRTDECEIWIPDLLAGRELAARAESGGPLRQLSVDGSWTSVSFIDCCISAHAATPADFHWSMSDDAVWELEQKLSIKALHADGPTGRTDVFGGGNTRGLVTYPGTQESTDATARYTAVRVQSADATDLLLFYFRSSGSTEELPGVLASIRFPTPRFDGDEAAVGARLKAVAAVLSVQLPRRGS